MVFASFIRRGQDIKDIREVLGKDGEHIQIVAKIENRQGLNNFEEILKETDAVMVARGDVSCPRPFWFRRTRAMAMFYFPLSDSRILTLLAAWYRDPGR
jgi:hypothetical protein